MNSTKKRPSRLQLTFLVISVFFATSCTVIEAIFRGLSDLEREVDALQARPQTSIADLSPRGISVYLAAWPNVDTGEEFLQWLPQQFKEDWIMMTRSESLQTGTATSPRIILRNGRNFTQVFAFTLKRDPSSFPLAHPDVIEYMQFDDVTKQFRFHEIDLRKPSPISRMSADNANCIHCHGGSRENLRPNWDTFNSWAGMLPFSGDRIYPGSVEEAAMKKILNLTESPDLAPIIRQLTLPHGITRAGDGTISINYPPPLPPDFPFPRPEPLISTRNDYNFDGRPASFPPAGTPVLQGGPFRVISEPTPSRSDVDGLSAYGRGRALFDGLTALNAQRVARELTTHPRTPIDIRPITLAIANKCLKDDGTSVISDNIIRVMIDSGGIDRRLFFETSHGMMNYSTLYEDTLLDRRSSSARRKADIQKLNLDGSDALSPGLIPTYGPRSSDIGLERIRQEVFQQPTRGDHITRLLLDGEDAHPSTSQITLFRLFLEPLGVAVDKWSMSVRGRSRTYTFGGQFGAYIQAIKELGSSDCQQLIADSQTQFARLPTMNTLPTSYADVQKIFNRNCTECHSRFGYPPAFPPGSLVDLTDGPGHDNAQSRARSGSLMSRIAITPATGTSSMPLGGPPLSQADIATIQRWVNAGAP